MTAWEVLRDAPRRIGHGVGSRPQLRGLPRPSRRLSTAWFAVLMVAILVAGTVGQLFFTTYLQSQAFDVRQAQRQAAELGYQVSDLESRVYAAQAPIALARRATSLGMVPASGGAFVDLSTGRVIGQAVPATGDELPGLLEPRPRTEDPASGSETTAAEAAETEPEQATTP
ncbi:MAG: hypothetical protein ACK5LN_02705 [Propioniciclava sp.]